MKLRGSEKNKFLNLILIMVMIFLLLACFITFLIDVDKNKGIIPIIFFLLMIYSLVTFVFYLFHSHSLSNNFSRKINFKISYIIFFIVNLFLFYISYITLWI